MKVTDPVSSAKFKPVRKVEWNLLDQDERKLVLKTLAVNKEAIQAKIDAIALSRGARR